MSHARETFRVQRSTRAARTTFVFLTDQLWPCFKIYFSSRCWAWSYVSLISRDEMHLVCQWKIVALLTEKVANYYSWIYSAISDTIALNESQESARNTWSCCNPLTFDMSEHARDRRLILPVFLACSYIKCVIFSESINAFLTRHREGDAPYIFLPVDFTSHGKCFSQSR